MKPPVRYKHIDHTADAGLRIYGPSPATLFEHAAEGLFDIITDRRKVVAEAEKQVQVSATDWEALLVAWLSELNFLFLTERFLFKQFLVTEIAETRLEGSARGELLDLRRHEIYTEVKAVTYHGLFVRQDEKNWEAQVIFDL